MLCGLRGEFPGVDGEFWPGSPGHGICFVGEFLRREGEIALIGPAVTVALKAQVFSPGFYLI